MIQPISKDYYPANAHEHFLFVTMPTNHADLFRALLDALGVAYWFSYSPRSEQKRRIQSRGCNEADFREALNMFHMEHALPALAKNLNNEVDKLLPVG